MKKIAVILGVLLLAGCGTEAKNLSKKDRQPPTGKKPSPECPTIAPYHQVILSLKKAPPAKLALEIDGKREFDECRAVEEEPPFVEILRDSGNKLTFTVVHQSAYRELPKEISFRLLDLGTCGGSEAPVIGLERQPLVFVTDYPNGAECPSRTYATLRVLEP